MADVDVPALAEVLGTRQDTVKKCIVQTAKKRKVAVGTARDALVVHYLVQPMELGISKKFGLTQAENDVFKKYIQHIHPESRVAFIRKVFDSQDRAYLDQFLDTEFEQFGEQVFGPGQDLEDEGIQQTDLYETRQTNDSTKYILIYNALLAKLRKLPAQERNQIMSVNFGFDSTTKDKIERRKEFYEAYKAYIAQLSQEEFETLVDKLFSKNVDNPFSKTEPLKSPEKTPPKKQKAALRSDLEKATEKYKRELLEKQRFKSIRKKSPPKRTKKEIVQPWQGESPRHVENGVDIVTHPDGLVVHIPYKNGKKDGVLRGYFQGDTLRPWGVVGYKNDVLSGRRILFHENGTKRLKEKYTNGKLTGTKKEWDVSGKLIKHEIWHNGQLEDVVKNVVVEPKKVSQINPYWL
jgi:antitoxin component YwqK of YwqJK toxin-antitoxin module